MPTPPETAARAYRQSQLGLDRWRTLHSLLVEEGCLPPRVVRLLVSCLKAATREYRAAERQLFDQLDIAATDLMTADDFLSPAEQQGRLLDRAAFHRALAQQVRAPEHRELHQRLADQLAAFAATIEPGDPP